MGVKAHYRAIRLRRLNENAIPPNTVLIHCRRYELKSFQQRGQFVQRFDARLRGVALVVAVSVQ